MYVCMYIHIMYVYTYKYLYICIHMYIYIYVIVLCLGIRQIVGQEIALLHTFEYLHLNIYWRIFTDILIGDDISYEEWNRLERDVAMYTYIYGFMYVCLLSLSYLLIFTLPTQSSASYYITTWHETAAQTQSLSRSLSHTDRTSYPQRNRAHHASSCHPG